MALQHEKPNPLNYFELRRVTFACPHFNYFLIKKYNPAQIKKISSWVMDNLNKRYYIGQEIVLDYTNTLVYNTRIGFESESELTVFLLSCPHIDK